MIDVDLITNDTPVPVSVESAVVTSGGGATYSKATESKDGLMSKEDKKKLNEFDSASTYAKKTYVDTEVATYVTNHKDELKGDKGETGAIGEKGDKGDTGATGAKGDKGDKGNDGYTPVKGVDYFDGTNGTNGNDYVITDADYNAIADVVLTKLTSAESVSV